MAAFFSRQTVTVEHVLNMAWVEHTKGNLPGSAAKCECPGPRAQPAVPFALLDGHDVLHFAPDYQQFAPNGGEGPDRQARLKEKPTDIKPMGHPYRSRRSCSIIFGGTML